MNMNMMNMTKESHMMDIILGTKIKKSNTIKSAQSTVRTLSNLP